MHLFKINYLVVYKKSWREKMKMNNMHMLNNDLRIFMSQNYCEM